MIDSIEDTVKKLVDESRQNTPDFGKNNIFQRSRFASSVSAVMNAAANTNSVNFAATVISAIAANANELLAADNNPENDAQEVSNETAQAGAQALAFETESDNETEIVEDEEIPADEEPVVTEDDDAVDEEAIPVSVDENETEKDLQTDMVDEIYDESEENENMLDSYSAKLAMENLAKDAAQTALNETTDRGGFKASGSATVSVGGRLQSADRKSETGRTRRFISYEDKNRRAALADKVENSKKVVMKRGQKKNS